MSNKLDESHIDHLAHLARLSLTSKEKERFSQQISAILEHVGQLRKIDSQSASSISQISGLENIVRDDNGRVSSETLERDESLKNASARQNGYVKMRSIF